MDAEPCEALAEQQYAAGLAAFRRGDNAESRRLNQAAIATATTIASDRGQALGHIGLSRADFRDGDFASGAGNAMVAERHARACEAADLQTTARHMMAELTRAQGKYAEAVPLYENLLAADEASGDHGSLAMEHTNLGSVLVQIGDFQAARGHLERALELSSEKSGLLLYILLGFAGLYARDGKSQAAGCLLGAVEAHLEAAGEVLDPGEALELASHVAAAKHGDADFEAAYARGRGMTLPQAQAHLI